MLEFFCPLADMRARHYALYFMYMVMKGISRNPS